MAKAHKDDEAAPKKAAYEAPRDGSKVLAHAGGEPVVVAWDETRGAWLDRHGFTVVPDRFAPLPEA